MWNYFARGNSSGTRQKELVWSALGAMWARPMAAVTVTVWLTLDKRRFGEKKKLMKKHYEC